MAGRQVEKIKEKKKGKKTIGSSLLHRRNKRNVWKVAIKRKNTREANLFFILKQSRSCAQGIITTVASFSCFVSSATLSSLSLSLLLSCNFLFNLGSLFVEQFTYVRMYVNVRASSLISYTRNSIRIGLEDASETSSPPPPPLSSCNRFVASFRPRWEEEGEDCFDRERN